MMCSDSMYSEGTLGACEAAPTGASWAYHKGEIVVNGRSWAMRITTCSDSACTSGCGQMKPQALDECGNAIGFDNKFTYLGSDTLMAAPGTMTSVSGGSGAAPSPPPTTGSSPAPGPSPEDIMGDTNYGADQDTPTTASPGTASGGTAVDSAALVSLSAVVMLLLTVAFF